MKTKPTKTKGEAATTTVAPRYTHTLAEIAAHFGVSARTVAYWMAREDFPKIVVTKRQRAYIFDVDLLTMWLGTLPPPRRAQPAKWRRKLGLPTHATSDGDATRKAREATKAKFAAIVAGWKPEPTGSRGLFA